MPLRSQTSLTCVAASASHEQKRIVEVFFHDCPPSDASFVTPPSLLPGLRSTCVFTMASVVFLSFFGSCHRSQYRILIGLRAPQASSKLSGTPYPKAKGIIMAIFHSNSDIGRALEFAHHASPTLAQSPKGDTSHFKNL